MTSCSETREKIHLYLDGELPQGEVLELERHLVECGGCNAEYQSLRAVVDTLRGAHPLFEPPEGSYEAAREIVARHSAARPWLKAAAIFAPAAAVGVLLLLWLWAWRAPRFDAFAAETHLRYAKGAMPLDVASDSPEAVSRWLRGRLPFSLELPDHPVGPGERKPYRLVGARLLQFVNDDVGYLAYEMDGRPISLLLASAPAAAPSGGEIFRSGKLVFHLTQYKGLKVISWTDRGLHYSLVSELAARGAASCVICHGSAAGRRMIEEFAPLREPRGRLQNAPQTR